MVDDYLSDREQEEALRNWWRENWSWILGGVVLGLALLGGWQYFKSYTTKRAVEAASLYSDFQAPNTPEEKRNAALDRLIADFPRSPYTVQARLLRAKTHIEASEFDQAATLLRAVVESAKDEELVHIARLRLARVLIQQGKHDEALNLLKPETAGAFAAQVREVRGDALFAKGDRDAARAEYAAALAANADAMTDRTLLEMKLQQTGGTTAANLEAPPAEGQP